MKKLIVVLAIIGAILLGGVVTGAVVLSNPKTQAKLAVSNTFNAVKSHEMVKSMSKTAEKGSMTVTANVATEEISLNATAKVLTDSASRSVAVRDASVKVTSGDESAKLTGEAYIGYDNIYANLNGNKLGITRGESWSNFEDSDLGKEVLGKDDAVDNLLETVFGLYDDGKLEKLDKDSEKVIKKVSDKVIDLVFENAEIEKKDKKGNTQIVITFDEKSVEGFLEGLVEYLKENKEIEGLLEDYNDLFAPILAEAFNGDEDDDAVEIYEEMIEELEEELDDLDMGDGEVEVALVTTSLIPQLVSVEVAFDGEDMFAIEFGENGFKNTDKIEISTRNWTTGKLETVATCKIKNDDTKASFELTIEDGEDDIVVSYSRKKDGGKYTVKVSEGEEVYATVEGTLTYDKKNLDLSVTRIVAGEYFDTKENLQKFEFKIALCAGEEIPKDMRENTSYKDIFKMKEEDYVDLAEKLEEDLGVFMDVVRDLT